MIAYSVELSLCCVPLLFDTHIYLLSASEFLNMIMLSIRNSASILVFSVMVLEDLGVVNTDVIFFFFRYLSRE